MLFQNYRQLTLLQGVYLLLEIKAKKEKATMGKFKTIFAACLSLGAVAGAGYYIYRKFARKYEKKEDDNLTQVKMSHKFIATRFKYSQTGFLLCRV